jgi:hypothetical protein
MTALDVPGTSLCDAAPADPPVFVADVEGQQSQEFLTLRSPMNWAEECQSPTATISFLGQQVIRYIGGDVNLVE